MEARIDPAQETSAKTAARRHGAGAGGLGRESRDGCRSGSDPRGDAPRYVDSGELLGSGREVQFLHG
ncbi:MAG: hypothetical protein ACYC6Y_23445, partial [Thermoguttaceae bacterium]